MAPPDHEIVRADGSEWLQSPVEPRRAGVRLLHADPELGRMLDEHVRARLVPLLRVGVESLECGTWRPADLPGDRDGLGLLVLDGLMLRDLSVNERCCAELVGPGDVLRPWPDPDGEAGAPLTGRLEWQVVDGPVRVAVLDRRVGAAIGRFPELLNEVLDRVLLRARGLQFQLALTQIHGISRRLELLLWHLADRWGRVTVDGVVLPLNLTHEMLGRLIGARRPSVTTALRGLCDRGDVVRTREGWLLRTDRATELDGAVSAR
jgi:hypothetical protein